MKPVVDPNPFATAIDSFLVDLEMKIDGDALVYAWLIDLEGRHVIERNYDPRLVGLAGTLEPRSKVLFATDEFAPIRNLGLSQQTLAAWKEETKCQYFGAFEVTPHKFMLFLLLEKKPKSLELLGGEIKRLAKLIYQLQSPRVALTDRLQVLTSREREICDLAVQGLSNQEIAEKLDLSVARVKQALSSAYSRLEVANRAELIKLFS